MTFSQGESFISADMSDFVSYSSYSAPAENASSMRLLRDKLEIPATGDLIVRPRINALMERSMEQFPATLITGRSGTGKTAIAADLARKQPKTAWLTVESADAEWKSFAGYFAAAVTHDRSSTYQHPRSKGGENITQDEIAAFLIRIFTNRYVNPDEESLIVIDDLHYIFDAPWFETFFPLLLYSLPSNTHLLLLSRSKPPSPLWRLRSKQMLGVVDEKVLAFTLEETLQLFKSLGISVERAPSSLESSFGRISKLLTAAEQIPG
jgi:ATP/maltotriose-dependent transcriptional regulator MalT